MRIILLTIENFQEMYAYSSTGSKQEALGSFPCNLSRNNHFKVLCLQENIVNSFKLIFI